MFKNRYFVILACLLLGLSFVYCSAQSFSTSTNKGSGSSGGLGGAVALPNIIAGTVSGASSKKSMEKRAGTDSCSNSAFDIYLIGGDGSKLFSGKAVNGKFATVAPETDEIVIEFACGMKCFGKPNTTGLVCDPVSSAIVASLEAAIGQNVKDSELYKGLAISTIAEGMVETLKLISRLDPTKDYIAMIEEAYATVTTDLAAALQAIISASPVSTIFNTLAALAQQTYNTNDGIINQGLSETDARNQAVAQSWSVENVINLLTGYGINIEIAVDAVGKNSMLALYTDFMTSIDVMIAADKVDLENPTNLNLIKGLRAYVMKLYNKIYVTKELSQVALYCNAEMNESGPMGLDKKPIKYPPYKYNDGGIDKLTCLHHSDAADPKYIGTGTLGITTADNTIVKTAGIEDMYDVELVIGPAVVEPNRNDKAGKYINENKINEINISVMDIFPEFMQAMLPGGACYSFVTLDENNNPTAFAAGFTTCIADNGYDKYTSGLVGIYRFFRDENLRNVKFSLGGSDKKGGLYKAFTGLSYMGIVVDADLWQFGLWDYMVQVDFGESWNLQMAKYVFDDQSTFFQSVFRIACPEPLCSAVGSTTMTVDQIKNVYDLMRPTYYSTMGMFEKIPTMDEIRKSIFEEGHHEPYNVIGASTYYVKGNKSASDQYKADAPILCEIQNANAVGDFVQGTSTVACKVARDTSDVWVDGKPNAVTQAKYKKFFALWESGGGEAGSQDIYYSLLNFNTGMPYELNGRQFKIRGIMSGYTPPDNPTVDGKAFYPVNKEFCNTWDDGTGSMQSYCWTEMFDYVAVQFSADWYPTAYYNPYSWNISLTDAWGYSFYLNAAYTDNATPNDYTDDRAVCVDASGVTVDTNDNSNVTAPIVISGKLVDCYNNSLQQYYYLQPGWGDPTKDMTRYTLTRNDGLWMWSSGAHAIITSPVSAGTGVSVPVDDSTKFTAGDIVEIWDNYNWELVKVQSVVSGTPGTIVIASMSKSFTTDGGSINKNYNNISLQAVENELANAPFSLTGGLLGPGNAYSWLNNYEIANLAHDPKFDPYCDDKNGDGICGCGTWNADKTAFTTLVDQSQCTLDNDANPAEPTIAELPYCADCQMDPNTTHIKAWIDNYGNQSGMTLVAHLKSYDDSKSITASMLWADWPKMFECVDTSRKLDGIDISRIDGYTGTTGDENIGYGCGPTIAQFPEPGPVRLKKITKRNNAYNIEKPNTVMKLISAATATIGTGVALDPTKNYFVFQEALPLVILRTMMPINAKFEAPDGTEIPGVSVYFRKVRVPNVGTEDPISGLLRAFLEQAGAISPVAK
jgi:hypothetical protein